MNHKKHTATQNAAERLAEHEHLPEAPAMPLSADQINHGRFPGETPLTGEDRPVDQPLNKQEGFDPTGPQARAAAGHPDLRSQGHTTMPPAHSNSPDFGREEMAPNAVPKLHP